MEPLDESDERLEGVLRAHGLKFRVREDKVRVSEAVFHRMAQRRERAFLVVERKLHNREPDVRFEQVGLLACRLAEPFECRVQLPRPVRRHTGKETGNRIVRCGHHAVVKALCLGGVAVVEVDGGEAVERVHLIGATSEGFFERLARLAEERKVVERDAEPREEHRVVRPLPEGAVEGNPAVSRRAWRVKAVLELRRIPLPGGLRQLTTELRRSEADLDRPQRTDALFELPLEARSEVSFAVARDFHRHEADDRPQRRHTHDHRLRREAGMPAHRADDPVEAALHERCEQASLRFPVKRSDDGRAHHLVADRTLEIVLTVGHYAFCPTSAATVR